MTKEEKISRRKYIAIAAAGAAAVVIGGAAYYLSGAGPGAKKAIKLGVPVGLTGRYAGVGQDERDGVLLAVEEINEEGGILGNPIETYVEDIESLEAGIVTSVFTKLVSRDKVDFIITHFADSACSEYDIAQEGKVPYLSAGFAQSAEAIIKPNPDAYSYCWLQVPSYVLYQTEFPKYIKKLIDEGKYEPINKKICVIKRSSEYSLYIADGLKENFQKMGWTVTFDELIPEAKVEDWSAILSKIRADPPAIVIDTIYTSSSDALFLKSFLEDPTPSLLYIQASPTYPEFKEMTGDLADGVLHVYGIRPLREGHPYVTKYEERWGRKPSPYGVRGYDQVYVMKQAMERAGDPFNHEAVANALAYTDYDGNEGHAVMDTSIHMLIGGGEYVPFPVFQIENTESWMLYPELVAEREFVYPPWYQKGLAKYGK